MTGTKSQIAKSHVARQAAEAAGVPFIDIKRSKVRKGAFQGVPMISEAPSQA